MSVLGQFQFRRDLPANWTAQNPILLDGEMGIERGTGLFKLGDGVTPWNSLPYGGLIGSPGEASVTAVGATTVVNPNVNPSVTDADPGPDADLRFNLPRAVQFSAISATSLPSSQVAGVNVTGTQEGDVELEFLIPIGAKGWSPVLSNVADGERRVLRLVDWVGGEGTKPAVPTDNYIGAAGFTNLAGATDIRGGVGQTGPAVPLSNTPPGAVGTASAGDSAEASRANHTHAGVTSVSVNGGAAQQGAVVLSVPSFVKGRLAANTTTNATAATAAVAIFTVAIPPGQAAHISANVASTTNATTVGSGIGIRLAQGAGANAAAQGGWSAQVGSAPAAGLAQFFDGDIITAAAGATSSASVVNTVGSATAGTPVGAVLLADIHNPSSNATATASVIIHAEAAGTMAAFAGSAFTAVVG